MGKKSSHGMLRAVAGGAEDHPEEIPPARHGPAVGDRIRLNLGCRGRRWRGWLNVDLPGSGADVECDIKTLPYGDGEVDEIQAIHVFEHLYFWEAEPALKEWLRVLKPGARLVLELPCLDKIIACFSHPKYKDNPKLTLWGLYGEVVHKDVGMCHKWAWSVQELVNLLAQVGFVEIERDHPMFHKQERDMRIVAHKAAHEPRVP